MNTGALGRWSYLPSCSKPFHIWHLRKLWLCEAEEIWGGQWGREGLECLHTGVDDASLALNLVKGPKSCAVAIACLPHPEKPSHHHQAKAEAAFTALAGPSQSHVNTRPQESANFLTDVFPESFPRTFCFYCQSVESVSCGNGTGVRKTHQDVCFSSVTLHCIKIQNVKVFI